MTEFYEKYIQTTKLPKILKDFCRESSITHGFVLSKALNTLRVQKELNLNIRLCVIMEKMVLNYLGKYLRI